MKTGLILGMAVATGVFASAGASAGPIYRLQDLGTLGGTYSYPYGMNASGQVVGGAATTGNSTEHAFLYSNGKMTDIGTLGGNSSIASGINSAGQIVGRSDVTPGGVTHAFLDNGAKMTDLGTLGGPSSYAAGINSSGLIVGQALTASFNQHAFRYTAGTMTDLGTLGGTFSEAASVNDSGQVVGDTGGNSLFHAFLYSAGQLKDLGTLGGSSFAYAVNSTGQVAGTFYLSGNAGTTHAFLYSQSAMKDLGTLNGSASGAWGINAAGQVVGDADVVGDFVNHAFLYTGGTMRDLNGLIDGSGNGWTVITARAINDNGWIAGVADGSSGIQHAVLLIPVPEPASIALFAIGAGLIACLQFKHQRRKTLKVVYGRRCGSMWSEARGRQ